MEGIAKNDRVFVRTNLLECMECPYALYRDKNILFCDVCMKKAMAAIKNKKSVNNKRGVSHDNSS